MENDGDREGKEECTGRERTLPRHLAFPFGSSFMSRSPTATVTNHHRLSGLKLKFIIL